MLFCRSWSTKHRTQPPNPKPKKGLTRPAHQNHRAHSINFQRKSADLRAWSQHAMGTGKETDAPQTFDVAPACRHTLTSLNRQRSSLKYMPFNACIVSPEANATDLDKHISHKTNPPGTRPGGRKLLELVSTYRSAQA